MTANPPSSAACASGIDTATRTSYGILKTTARCDKHVLQWYIKNPHVIADIPKHLLSSVQLGFAHDFTDGTIFVGERAFRRIHMRYSAAHAHQMNMGLTQASVLEEWSGAMTSLNNVTSRENQDGYLDLNIPLDQWPLAMAIAAFDAITTVLDYSASPSRPQIDAYIADNWYSMFPGLKWSALQQMHVAGLIPDDVHAFVSLVCDGMTRAPGGTELPTTVNLE